MEKIVTSRYFDLTKSRFVETEEFEVDISYSNPEINSTVMFQQDLTIYLGILYQDFKIVIVKEFECVDQRDCDIVMSVFNATSDVYMQLFKNMITKITIENQPQRKMRGFK